jgi:hypothetical protein
MMRGRRLGRSPLTGPGAPMGSWSADEEPWLSVPTSNFEDEFRRLHAFRGALAILRWDAAVVMPSGSADVRGEQLGSSRNRMPRAL